MAHGLDEYTSIYIVRTLLRAMKAQQPTYVSSKAKEGR